MNMEWLKRYTAAMLGLIMIVATGITAHAEETCRNIISWVSIPGVDGCTCYMLEEAL